MSLFKAICDETQNLVRNLSKQIVKNGVEICPIAEYGGQYRFNPNGIGDTKVKRRIWNGASQTVLSGESQTVARGHSPQRGLRAKQIFLPNQIS